ncbi:MAG: UDP-glucose--hexose-1-phosphate uridylyltransferase [Fusobacteriaceae bacterium]|jgi:UDPglucose--hexose-1-phosphate uridylyltransferase|nr:UDP-glucose--hexose-1-phosphate uridylyltransferase [Fusobacteriaceae bacterium]
MDIYYYIKVIIHYGLKNNLIEEFDKIFIINQLLKLFELDEWIEPNHLSFDIPDSPQTILDSLCDYAVKMNLIEDSQGMRDLFDTKIMGILTPLPSIVINKFYDICNIANKKEATKWYYNFSQKTNYIRTERINKNVYWTVDTDYSSLEITINLSKPEKDPKDIEREKNAIQKSYPKCLLCYENVGYSGRVDHPSRENHRVIPVDISSDKNEDWFIQYSPYIYYNEHIIVFSIKHSPMKIDIDTFDRITRFVEIYPHYFLGSNADLPIVGGSILNHNHYQGGNHLFPMAKAKIEKQIVFKNYENIEAGILKWPMSVIRLKSPDRKKLISLANKILLSWRTHSDKSLDILAFSDDLPHNTITPIARKTESGFELDLVLRNNRTTEKFPLGIFHPHDEVHNIKKENIGLIEVMGLAVLPGRLKEELEILESYMVVENWKEKIIENKKVSKHLNWAEEIINSNNNITEENIHDILKSEVGKTILKVLTYAGVYKRDKNGKNGFLKFIDSINEI